LGARFANSGWAYTLDTLGYAPGRYALTVLAFATGSARSTERSLVVNLLEPGQFEFGDGFYASEGPAPSPLPRWTNGDAIIDVYPRRPGPLAVRMLVQQPTFGKPRYVPNVRLLWDGKPELPGGWAVSAFPEDGYELQLSLDPPGPARRHQLEIVSPTFVPREREKGSADPRSLGVRLYSLSVQAGGEPLIEPGKQVGSLLGEG
ncbi:MAG: hypothetical protein KGJ86_15595, partial [Chloroflexota bacterium]|nr:hypothetical protein [Chloroflexota bacterium]